MTNWVVPVAADMNLVLAQPAIDKATAIGATDVTDKMTGIIALVVERVRGVIASNSRNQLSPTSGSIPPEAKQYVLVLAARQLIDSIPTMAAAIGANENFPTLYTKAEDWLKEVREGLRVTVPSDSRGDLAGPDFGGNEYVDMTVN